MKKIYLTNGNDIEMEIAKGFYENNGYKTQNADQILFKTLKNGSQQTLLYAELGLLSCCDFAAFHPNWFLDPELVLIYNFCKTVGIPILKAGSFDEPEEKITYKVERPKIMEEV